METTCSNCQREKVQLNDSFLFFDPTKSMVFENSGDLRRPRNKKNPVLDSMLNFVIVEERNEINTSQVFKRIENVRELVVSAPKENPEKLCDDLCADCLKEVLIEVNKELSEEEEQLGWSRQALHRLQSVSDPDLDSLTEEELLQQISKLEGEDQSLDRRLEQLHFEEKTIDDKMSQLDKKHQLASRDAISCELMAADEEFFEAEEEKDGLQTQLNRDQAALDKLKKMNIFDELFEIRFTENFGVINGCRLGTTSSNPVEWSEINEGLGHVLLLLYCVGKALFPKFKYSKYQLRPLGSSSNIIQKTEPNSAHQAQEYELFTTNPFGGYLGRFVSWKATSFDNALMALLSCTEELSNYISTQLESHRLPYPIDEKDGKIGGFNIRTQANTEEGWSKGMFNLLQDVFRIYWNFALIYEKMKNDNNNSQNAQKSP